MNDHEEDFAGLLGHYRGRAGFTQQELANKIAVHRRTIDNWESRASLPQLRGQVLRIADELFLSKEERKALIQAAGFSLERWPTEVWTVPQQQDMFFTGRDEVFQSLRRLLVPGSTTALTQAISGMGGIGKTHMAIEYAYRFYQQYEAVLWLQADSWEILVEECIKLADELGLPEQKESEKVVAAVQHWLGKHRHWLLILDNVADPQKILPKFVPSRHQGCVLVTTRVHSVEPLAQTQVLSTMPEQEGILFLLRRTKRIAPKAGLEKANPEQYEEAKQIWQLMDGLPLALDQAGAYILETRCSFFAYRDQYTRQRAKFLHLRGKRFIGHEASVTTTFSLAFKRVEVLNPMAADILRICSLLHSTAIPEELFQEGAEHLGPRLATDRESWDLAIGMLQDYSLLQRNTDAKTLTIHQLVQVVLQNAMQVSEQEIWINRIITAVNAIFPYAEYKTWSQCKRLIAHALTCITRVQPLRLQRSRGFDLACLLFKVASYLGDRKQYVGAELFYHESLLVLQQVVGADHPLVASLLNNLALLYVEQGKHAEAEPLYHRALQILKQVLDSEHLDMADLLSELANLYRNLANLYKEQDKYTEAELLYRQALHIWEQVLGAEHPNVGQSLANLALLYVEQGKYTEAEPLYQQVLHIWEQTLNPEHPDLAILFNNLAMLYAKQEQYEKAEAFYQRALHIWEQVLGSEHSLVAITLQNLAELNGVQGRYEEAEPLYQRALHIREQSLGQYHTKTIETRKGYITLLQEMGRQDEAALLELPQSD